MAAYEWMRVIYLSWCRLLWKLCRMCLLQFFREFCSFSLKRSRRNPLFKNFNLSEKKQSGKDNLTDLCESHVMLRIVPVHEEHHIIRIIGELERDIGFRCINELESHWGWFFHTVDKHWSHMSVHAVVAWSIWRSLSDWKSVGSESQIKAKIVRGTERCDTIIECQFTTSHATINCDVEQSALGVELVGTEDWVNWACCILLGYNSPWNLEHKHGVHIHTIGDCLRTHKIQNLATGMIHPGSCLREVNSLLSLALF